MTMTLVKKTDEYSIFQRGDERYAVKDAAKRPVNGEDKVRILLEEGLIKVAEPAPAEAVAEEAPAEEAPVEEEAAADEAPADEAEAAPEEDGEAKE
ncbi:hypothetical protein [Congregibacter litoralis]|uniref:Uncharacterized protein n=1 Tax=Congregibacter litoralis KT71 TaxID=314285 RepID=A4ADH2_9GAMM|nr:hypothetical protein [Congregibacter litoralis]EAQ95970.1 hypothetical protein KT71_18242 [Congregibacter litoralis KT71]